MVSRKNVTEDFSDKQKYFQFNFIREVDIGADGKVSEHFMDQKHEF